MNAKRRSIRAAHAVGVLFTLSALAIHANLASADTPAICVTSNSQLISALAIAQTSAVSIELMQGTYDLKPTVWNGNTSPNTNAKFFAGSSLSGGYTNTSCSAQNIDRDNTTIIDSSTTPLDQFQILGDATIQGITFHLKNGLTILADGTSAAGLSAGTQLTLRRNVFTQTITSGYSPIYMYWNATTATGGTIRLVNNLIYENSSTSDVGAVQLFVLSGKPTFEAINNTVDNNGGMMEGMLLQVGSTIPVQAYNNILFGNGGLDLDIPASTNVRLVSNTIGTHSYSNTASVTGAKSGDPKLDASYKPITSPVSPSINTGVSSVTGGLPTSDLPGHPRQIGSEPDRGAYESNVNDLTTHMVMNTNDSGVGSLRDAISQSNTNNVPATISFNLGNACPYTISPITALPPITAPITFAGYSQTGSSPNTLSIGDDAVICVILDGTPHNLVDGLYVPDTASDATNINVDGMAFSGFAHGAVSLYGGSGHTVTGSHIGGNVGGVNLDPVGTGIIIGPGVHDVTIGGDYSDFSLRNIVGSATGNSISIDGPNDSSGAAHGNQVIDNYIGVGWNPAGSGSFTNRGNGGAGVVVGGYNNDIERNYFEYNTGYGVDLTGVTAHDNNVDSNFIGYIGSLTDTGSGNGGGVVNENDAHDNAIEYNSIWFNAGTAVRITNGQNNIIYDNQLVGNGGLGIDLAGAGVTLNDNDSGAQTGDYANHGLNFPVITGATGGHTKGTISGTLTTIPGFYYLQFYVSRSCDPSGYGEGEFYFAAAQLLVNGPTTNGQATASFSVVDSSSIGFVGHPIITAVATDGNNNTSEFSQCFTYDDDTLFADGFGGD